jgi:hypothetical protein
MIIDLKKPESGDKSSQCSRVPALFSSWLRGRIIGIKSKDYIRSKTYANEDYRLGSFGGFELY